MITLAPPSATATTTASPTPTITPEIAASATRTPSPTATPTEGIAASCGNGLIDLGESCATCPAGQTCQGCLPNQPCQLCSPDCAVAACTATTTSITFRIDLALPPGQDVGTVGILVGYRSSLVSLPSPPSSRFTNLQPGGNRTVSDFDYAAQYIYTLATGLSSGGLFSLRFDRCQGAASLTAADFSCVMQACVGGAGEVEGCNCSVTLP